MKYKCKTNCRKPESIQSFSYENIITRAGFNWCEALGWSTCDAPSPIVARKKMESVNQFAISRNGALKARSVKKF